MARLDASSVFLIMYVLTGLGVTVGFHRMLTHRAFKTTPLIRGVFTALGSAAIEGPAGDIPGSPTTASITRSPTGRAIRTVPHVDHGGGLRGALRGLLHAHVGWLFLHTHRGRRTRYAPDLLADRVVSAIDRRFLLCVAGGLLAPFLLGWAFGGTLRDAFTGLLWGGAVRVLVLHHSTFSINSLCHFFGRRKFEEDEFDNFPWLCCSTVGQA